MVKGRKKKKGRKCKEVRHHGHYFRSVFTTLTATSIQKQELKYHEIIFKNVHTCILGPF